MNNFATVIDTSFSAVPCACNVMDLRPLSRNTFQVELQSLSEVNYRAGQYLQLELDVHEDGNPLSLSYSIANRFNPEQPRRLVLFIQNGSMFADKILKCLHQLSEDGIALNILLPKGKAFLQTNLDLAHVFIAAGSGIAKIKCLTEEVLTQKPDANLSVYWSNKDVDDFYLCGEFQNWVNRHKHLSFTPILESASENWDGRSGYIYEVLAKDFEHLNGVQAYVCGSPKMVYGTIDKLKPIGLKQENCYSDVFEYAPRC